MQIPRINAKKLRRIWHQYFEESNQKKTSYIHDFLSMSHKKPNTLEGQYNIIYTFFQDNSKNLDKNQSNDVVKMSQSRKELLK